MSCVSRFDGGRCIYPLTVLIDGESGSTFLVKGCQYVQKLGYYNDVIKAPNKLDQFYPYDNGING